MENIIYNRTLIGIRIKTIPQGSIPQTDEKEPLQLVTLKHPQGTYLQAHLHKPQKRITQRLQECLFVRKGKIKIDLYDNNKKYARYLLLKQGEAFISVSGGIGIRFIQDSEVFEFKNGPFKPDKINIE